MSLDCQKMQTIYKVIWVLQNILYTSAPIITTVYWKMVYRGKTAG